MLRNGNSNSLIDMLGNVAGDADYVMGACRFPGCDNVRATTGKTGKGGRGYCDRHYRNLMRYGHPESKSERSRDGLLTAAYGYACHAGDVSRAIDFAVAVVGLRKWNVPEFDAELARDDIRLALASREGVQLLYTAMMYADCDAEAPQAEWLARKDRYLAAVDAFAALFKTVAYRRVAQ